MDPILGAILVEAAKGTLQFFFTSMSMAGQTPEQIEAAYASEKEKFNANKPELLLDV